MASIVCMSQGVAEVFRMKHILDKSSNGDGSKSPIVCESLTRLRDMGLSVKTLEITGIGKSVRVLQKHTSKDVRQIAWTLMKAWKATANAWFDTTEKKSVSLSSSKATPKASVEDRKSNKNHRKTPLKMFQQQQPKMVIRMKLKTERKSGVSETTSIPKGLVVPSQQKKVINLEDEEERFKAIKRKLQQGYEKVENIKRQRKIRVMEVHEVMQQGLVPQRRPVIRNKKW